MLERQLYQPAPGPGAAIWIGGGYADAGLTREEFITVSREDDAYVDWTRRVSADNGKTWSAPVPIPDAVRDTPEGGIVAYPAVAHVDPSTHKSYRFIMRRIWPGQKAYTYDFKANRHNFSDHVFVSEDGGPERLLRYEDGPDFDPHNIFNPAFLATNNAYFGTHPAFGDDGSVYYPMSCRGENLRERRGICLLRREKDGSWHPSNLQPIEHERSCVGLEEPAAARLRDGRILVVARGHATASTPGVKWMSLSHDAGRTLSPLEELRYDDGSRLFSPCSIHRFIRSTRDGQLYWLANITDQPPAGQGPRYPLCIARIDEDKAAVVKESVRVLDDRRPGEPEALQISNFSALENRQTLDFELIITLLGIDPTDFWRADAYKYVFSPSKA